MICTRCSGLTFVVDTQKDSESVIRQRRVAQECGYRFNTQECYYVRPGRIRKCHRGERRLEAADTATKDWERDALVVPEG